MNTSFAVVPSACLTSKPLFGGFGDMPTNYTPWTYLHGSLQDIEGGWDKFLWIGEAPNKEGIYSCTAIIGEEDRVSATAFLWEVYGKLTGLVVADDDDASMLYALKQFKAKSDYL